MKLLLLFLLPIFAIGQKTFSEIYYPEINKAELAITNEKYKEAIQHYEVSFAAVKQPLALDLYNAAVCKIRLNNFDGAKPFLLKLATKGLPIDILEKETIFKNAGSAWERFKPIYIQIQNSFVSTVPEEIRNLTEEIRSAESSFENQTFAAFKKVSQEELQKYTLIRKDLQEINELDETQKAIQKILSIKLQLEQILDSTGGFSENEVGVSDEKLLITWLNSRINLYTDQIMYVDHDKKTINVIKMPDQEKFDQEKYILQGIENGKWHRDSIKGIKSENKPNKYSIAEFTVEETCEETEFGFYLKSSTDENNDYSSHSFSESEELKLAKTLFNLKGNTDFKLSSPLVINRLFYASCESAKEELKAWKKLNLR